MPSRCRVTCCRRAACTRFWPSTAGSCFRMRCSLTYSPRRWGGPACRLTWSRRCWCSKRWKSACGLPVATAGFHSTVLTYWRRPLAASARRNQIFDAVREVVAATGALTGKTRRALDSTVLEDAVATQDTVIQLIAAIRRVRREVPGAAEVVGAHCTGHDYDDPGKPQIAWDDAERSEEHTSELQSRQYLVCRLLLEKKKK